AIMTKIVLIDDDRYITEPLTRALQQYEYEVGVANNGRDGLLLALSQNPDIVILDIMMPEMDGWAVCRELRERSNVPILMLTALGEEVDRILGLELGADDYLTKPFSTRELIARIKAMLRRVELDQAVSPSSVTTVGDIQMNLNTHRVYKGSEELSLRHKEFELLYLLMSQAGQAIPRSKIFDHVWGHDWVGDTRTLDVHIRWLREKIEDNPKNPQYIQTVRGVGYRFATS
ncbi:MAG: response regulator transcription factor, partial [Chloroflexota bacterium]